MLPNLRFLLAATLMTVVITFALLSQIASYLPQSGSARARAATPLPADTNHRVLLVSQASARRYVELERLTRVSDAAPAIVYETLWGTGDGEPQEFGQRETETALIIEPEAADAVPSSDVFAEIAAQDAAAQRTRHAAAAPIKVEIAGSAAFSVVAAIGSSAGEAAVKHDEAPEIEQAVVTQAAAENETPAAAETAPVRRDEEIVTASVPTAVSKPAGASARATLRKTVQRPAAKRAAARAPTPKAKAANITAARVKAARAANLAKKKKEQAKRRIARRQAAPAAAAQAQTFFPFSF